MMSGLDAPKILYSKRVRLSKLVCRACHTTFEKEIISLLFRVGAEDLLHDWAKDTVLLFVRTVVQYCCCTSTRTVV